LLGNRADTKVLWDESVKCITEGQFDIAAYGLQPLFEEFDLDYSEQTVFRREISTGGKSRAFINDTPVTLDVMRTLGSRLMDVHSQHETLELGTNRFQLDLVDSFAGNTKEQDAYRSAWKTFQQTRDTYSQLSSEAEKLKTEYEFNRFQLTELQQIALAPGEQEQLEADVKVSEHAEDIKSRLTQIVQVLGDTEMSAQATLSQATGLLQPIRDFSPILQQLSDRLGQLRIELKDVLGEISSAEERMEIDPGRTRQMQERLDQLNSLLQKHRAPDISALLAIQATLEEQVRKTVNLDDDLSRAKSAFEKAEKAMQAAAEKLRKTRTASFPALCTALVTLLKSLGIPQAVLEIEHKAVAPAVNGADQVELLFSANKGIPPRSLESVASGGEFSRLMFCVKYVMAERKALPTLVLDEIDTGVSGEIAIQLGNLMQKMAKRHQLITITHLPQIAAKGHAHFLVFKDTGSLKASTGIRGLDEEERVEEIAKMIGGAAPSPLAKANARELLGV